MVVTRVRFAEVGVPAVTGYFAEINTGGAESCIINQSTRDGKPTVRVNGWPRPMAAGSARYYYKGFPVSCRHASVEAVIEKIR